MLSSFSNGAPILLSRRNKKFCNDLQARTGLGHHRKLARILSYTGALIQAIFIVHNYLLFQTTTNVFITNPRSAELPALSLCFFYKLEQLRLEANTSMSNISSMTLTQINVSLPTWNDYVMSCKVLNNSYMFEDCRDVSSQIVQYLSLYSKCYTLFEHQNPAILYEEEKIGSNWMINVLLNVSQISTNNIGVYLTHHNDELDESLGNPSFIQFDSYNFNRAFITFEQTKIRHLPAPYWPSCIDYAKIPCKSRGTCLRRCIMETSYAQNNAWNDRRYVKLESLFGDGRFAALSESKITSYCHAKFISVPCTYYIYNAVLASQIMNPFRTNDTYQINVAFPLGKFTEVDYVSLQSFIDFICYLTSIVSLWTEISMIQIVEKLLSFIERPVIKEKISNNISTAHDVRFPPTESWSKTRKNIWWKVAETSSISPKRQGHKKIHSLQKSLRKF